MKKKWIYHLQKETRNNENFIDMMFFMLLLRKYEKGFIVSHGHSKNIF